MFLSAALLTLASSTTPTCFAPPLENRREEVTTKYHELFEARNVPGMQELWSENVDLVLQVIDADLEGSLAKWEAAKDAPPLQEIEALQERAMFGARCASVALSQPIFLDYAASFSGWTDEQKHDFRQGQKVYARALQELEEGGDPEVAWEAAKEVVLRALPLGDWWGVAMGYGVQGKALQQMGQLEDALSAYSRGRLLNADLGLQHAEYRNLQGMLSCLRSLERWERALVVAEAAIEYAKVFGDEAGLKSARTARQEVATKLGLEPAQD